VPFLLCEIQIFALYKLTQLWRLLYSMMCHRVGCCIDRGQLKYGGTRAEIRFRLSANRTSLFKSAGRQFIRLLAAEVCASAFIVGSNAGYATFRGSVKGTSYPLNSPFSLSLPLPSVTVCHHISTGFYQTFRGSFYLLPQGVTVSQAWKSSYPLMFHLDLTSRQST